MELVSIAYDLDIDHPEKMTAEELKNAILTSPPAGNKKNPEKFRLYGSTEIPDADDRIIILTKKKLKHIKKVCDLFVRSVFDIIFDNI